MNPKSYLDIRMIFNHDLIVKNISELCANHKKIGIITMNEPTHLLKISLHAWQLCCWEDKPCTAFYRGVEDASSQLTQKMMLK